MTTTHRIYRTVVLRALASLIAAMALLSLADSHDVFASEIYPSGTVGFDISFPQCDTNMSPESLANGIDLEFGVLGVTGGRPFTENRCFADQYQALAGQGLPVSLYMNLSSPRGRTSSYGQTGPKGTCSSDDSACLSYNFGWNAAKHAYSFASETIEPLDRSSAPNTWWLDVEIANYWSRDPTLNAQVLQGAIDFFQENVDGSTIGIYSVASMWNRIAGRSYQPDVPTWLAGARSLAHASRLCDQTSLTGGPIALVQYATRLLDLNYAC